MILQVSRLVSSGRFILWKAFPLPPFGEYIRKTGPLHCQEAPAPSPGAWSLPCSESSLVKLEWSWKPSWLWNHPQIVNPFKFLLNWLSKHLFEPASMESRLSRIPSKFPGSCTISEYSVQSPKHARGISWGCELYSRWREPQIPRGGWLSVSGPKMVGMSCGMLGSPPGGLIPIVAEVSSQTSVSSCAAVIGLHYPHLHRRQPL